MSASGPTPASSPYFVLCRDKLDHNLLLLQNSEWVEFKERPNKSYLKPGKELAYKDFITALKEVVYGYYQEDRFPRCVRESRMPNHVEIYPEFEPILRQGFERALEAKARRAEFTSRRLGF